MIKVHIRTRQKQAENAASDWHEQYYSQQGGWEQVKHGSAEIIYNQLLALDPPTPDAVNIIIGNTSWTDCKCDHCGKYVEKVAQLGAEPDYESATAYVCIDCLRSALAALEAA